MCNVVTIPKFHLWRSKLVPVQATSPRCRLTANTLSAKRTEPEKPVSRTQWQSISAMNCMLATSANKFYCKRHRAMSCDCRDTFPFVAKTEVCESNTSCLWQYILGKVRKSDFAGDGRHRAMSSNSQKLVHKAHRKSFKHIYFPSDTQCKLQFQSLIRGDQSPNASDIAAMSSAWQHHQNTVRLCDIAFAQQLCCFMSCWSVYVAMVPNLQALQGHCKNQVLNVRHGMIYGASTCPYLCSGRKDL